MKKTYISAIALAATLVAPSAEAQRAETSTPAILSVAPTCALTPAGVIEQQKESTQEIFGAVIGTILAAVVGDLVKTGVNAAGNALEEASREQGFVAEGTTTYYSGQINFTTPAPQKADGSFGIAGPAKARFNPEPRCLHLFVPGAGPIDEIFSDATLTRNGTINFDWSGTDAEADRLRDEARASLVGLGVNGKPSLYAEILLVPGKEGFVARPMLVWYGSALKGAPKGASAAEMHLLFAAPSFDAAKPGIGTGFAGARLSLPKLAPKQVLSWDQLRGAASVMLPLRPTTGHIDTTTQAFNTAVAAVATAKATLRRAESAHRAAQRLAASDPKPAAQEALIIAAEAEAEAKLSLQLAEQAIADPQSVRAGATNVQTRIVIIRDENKFGMALAKALKGQAEAVGKAATDALAPKPDWIAADTVYLTALNDVEAKQAAYDAALATGDAAATLTAGHALRLAKAKANEAAVTSKRAAPYPGLLN